MHGSMTGIITRVTRKDRKKRRTRKWSWRTMGGSFVLSDDEKVNVEKKSVARPLLLVEMALPLLLSRSNLTSIMPIRRPLRM